MKQHASRIDQPMNQHLKKCEHFIELFKFTNRPELFNEQDISNDRDQDLPSPQFMLHSLLEKCEIIGSFLLCHLFIVRLAAEAISCADL